MHQTPESARVAGLPKMHQLVDEDVVAHGIRHLHESPVQADRPVRRAGPPARSLIADGHADHGQPMGLGQVAEPLWQLPGRPGLQVPLDRAAHVGVVLHLEAVEPAPHLPLSIDARDPDGGQHATDPDSVTRGPRAIGMPAVPRVAIALTRDPVGVTQKKLLGFSLRSPPGDRDARLSVWGQAQDITSRAPVSDEESFGRRTRCGRSFVDPGWAERFEVQAQLCRCRRVSRNRSRVGHGESVYVLGGRPSGLS